MNAIQRAFVYFENFKDNDIEDTLKQAKAELATLRAERDELKQAAVLAMRAVEEVAFTTLKPNMQRLDSYLANRLSDKLWEEINTAALAAYDKK